ncbi:MAG TPA: MFS transporter [Vicinamibacteria bacterium]|nr:MFS transporter [Vicinamibacteria bacterium]
MTVDAAPPNGLERGRWLAFAACVLVSLTNEVSGGALSLSFRDATSELHASTEAMQLVMTLSKLLFGAFMLLGGVLGDSYGRRRVLVWGSAGIVVASAMAAVSASATQLAIARGLDGLANAAVGPLCLALVLAIFPEEQRARGVGLFLGLSALGIALGPLLAGLVVQGLGWRAGFAAPALVAAVGGLGVRLFAPEARGTERRRLDGLGALGVSVALLALVFAVVDASSVGWANLRVLQALAVGAGALIGFIWWERRASDPLLDLRLFRSWPLNAALITGALLALVLGGAILPLLYFFQNVHGMKPVPALLHIVPLVIAAALFSPLAGSMLARRGARPVVLGGLGLVAAGCAILALLRPETPYLVILAALVLLGAGNIAVITAVTEIVLQSLPAERSGSAAALNNAATQVGGALGAATLTGVFLAAARGDYFARLAPTGLTIERIREVTKAWREAVRESASTGAKILPEGMEQHFEAAFRASFTVGVARVFLVAALIAVACAVLAWFGLAGRGAASSGRPDLGRAA